MVTPIVHFHVAPLVSQKAHKPVQGELKAGDKLFKVQALQHAGEQSCKFLEINSREITKCVEFLIQDNKFNPETAQSLKIDTHLKEVTVINSNGNKVIYQNISLPSFEQVDGKSATIQIQVVQKGLIRKAINLFKSLISSLFKSNPPLAAHLTNEFRHLLVRIPISVQEAIIHSLSKVSNNERHFINYLLENIDWEKSELSPVAVLAEIFSGAFVALDGNEAYEDWVSNFTNQMDRTNCSSHKSIDNQYSIQGSVVKENLFGNNDIDWNGDGEKIRVTWFQLERYSVTWGIEGILHGLTWFAYVATGKNQGPWGQSSYNEKNPLKLKLKPQLDPEGRVSKRSEALINA